MLKALDVPPGTSLAVHETGSVGPSAITNGMIAGAATAITVDLKQERLDLALRIGAANGLKPQTTNNAVASVKSIRILLRK